MSSVKFEGGKSKGGAQASAYLKHNDITPENRARVLAAKQAAGEDCFIDPNKSKNNFAIVNGEISTGDNYGAAWARYHARIEEIDASPLNTNKRKDRVTMQSCEVPVPEDLSGADKKEARKEWALGIYDIMAAKYGAHNIIQFVMHEDEVHDYIDAETHQERTSREHLHISFVPEIDGQLNGKWASRRSNIIAINKAVEDYTRKTYGVEFHTGSKKRSEAKINQLKAESRRLQEERQLMEQQRQAEAEQLKQANTALTAELNRIRKEKQEAEDELTTLKEAAAEAAAKMEAAKAGADKDIEYIKEARKQAEAEAGEIQRFLLYVDSRHEGSRVRALYDDFKHGRKEEAKAERPAPDINTVIEQATARAEDIQSRIRDIGRVIDAPTTAEAIQAQKRAAYEAEKARKQHEQTGVTMRTLQERIAENQRAMREANARTQYEP